MAMMDSRSALCCLWLATHAGVPANTQGGNLPQITAFEYKDLALAKYECSGTYPGAWDSDIIQIGGSLDCGERCKWAQIANHSGVDNNHQASLDFRIGYQAWTEYVDDVQGGIFIGNSSNASFNRYVNITVCNDGGYHKGKQVEDRAPNSERGPGVPIGHLGLTIP